MDSFDLSVKRFDEFAFEYATRFRNINAYLPSIDKFCDLISVNQPKILELACGPGNIMFDSKDPSSIINRCETYFIHAEHKNEITGQMSNTAFVEAMVHFREKWYIYYVMGEAGIGVITSDKKID